MVVVTRGRADAGALQYAHAIRDELGAGLVVAYDFETNKIPVDQPWVYTSSISGPGVQPGRSRVVYPEFQALLQPAADRPLKFYVGVGMADQAQATPRIEAASAGLTFEQLEAMTQAYAKLRDQSGANADLPKIEIAIGPRDGISWKPFGVKHHGVLMLADRGLILRLPKVLATSRYGSAYREILATWVREASVIARSASTTVPSMQIRRLRFGRIDAIPARNDQRGIVIGAPHGSFDWGTGELVQELSYRTGLPAVVTRGLTPIECDGWRINVNRPTERRYPTDTIERMTERAKEAYQHYFTSVSNAARGALDLYVDVHQNGTQEAIEVATLGVNVQQAVAIKSTYGKIRDRILRDAPDVAPVNLIIEPVDPVTIGAWAAKDDGILRLAKRSLHIELPARQIFYRDRSRRVYTMIFAELLKSLVSAESEVVQAKAAPSEARH